MSEVRAGIVLEAKDNATATLNKVRENLNSFTGANNSFVDSFKKLATGIGAIYAGSKLISFFKSSIEASNEADKAQAQLGAVLASTGEIAGVTAEKAIELSKAFQKQTTFGDEAILSAENMLLTFTNIKDNIFPEATKTVLDMSVALGQDTKNSAIQLGKALNDPILGVTALRKVGVNFTEQQQDQIKVLVESGRTLEAQKIILKELGTEFGGSASAQAETFAGKIAQMKENVGDLKEEIGKGLQASLIGLVESLQTSAEGFSETNQLALMTFDAFTTVEEVVVGLGNTLVGFGTIVGRVLNRAGEVLSGGIFSKDAREGFDETNDTLKEFAKSNDDSFNELVANNQKARAKLLASFDDIQKGGKSKLGDLTDTTKTMAKEVKEAFASLDNTYSDFNNGTGDTLFDIKEKHKETLASIKESISGVRKEITDLLDSYNEAKASDTKSVAEQVIATEQSIADIQKEMQTDVSATRYAELQAELTSKQQALADNAEFIKSIDAEVTEARRVAGLSDLARTIEEYNTKRELATIQYNETLANLKSELKEYKNKMKEENDLYKQKRDFIISLEEEVAERYKQLSKNNLSVTKETITKEIDYYKSLAEAINASKSGNASAVSRIQSNLVKKVDDVIITPQGSYSTHPDDYIIATKNPKSLGGGSTINVNINGGMYLDQNSARKIGDEIIRVLDLQYKS